MLRDEPQPECKSHTLTHIYRTDEMSNQSALFNYLCAKAGGYLKVFTWWYIGWREIQSYAVIADVEMMDPFSSVLLLMVWRTNFVSGA